jgi:hypothetical protein
MDTPEHEAKCQRCGISCHASITLKDGRDVVVEGLHCVYLKHEDSGLWSCTVYENRLTVAPWCHHVREAGPQGLLRHDCPYLEGVPGSRGKARLSSKDYAVVRDEILTNILARPTVNPHFSWKKFFKLLREHDPDGHYVLRENALRTSARVLREASMWTILKNMIKGST